METPPVKSVAMLMGRLEELNRAEVVLERADALRQEAVAARESNASLRAVIDEAKARNNDMAELNRACANLQSLVQKQNARCRQVEMMFATIQSKRDEEAHSCPKIPSSLAHISESMALVSEPLAIRETHMLQWAVKSATVAKAAPSTAGNVPYVVARAGISSAMRNREGPEALITRVGIHRLLDVLVLHDLEMFVLENSLKDAAEQLQMCVREADHESESLQEKIEKDTTTESSRVVTSADDVELEHEAQMQKLRKEQQQVYERFREVQFHVRRKGLRVVLSAAEGLSDAKGGQGHDEAKDEPHDQQELMLRLNDEKAAVAVCNDEYRQELSAFTLRKRHYAEKRQSLDSERRIVEAQLRRLAKENHELKCRLHKQKLVLGDGHPVPLADIDLAHSRFAHRATVDATASTISSDIREQEILLQANESSHKRREMEERRPRSVSPSPQRRTVSHR
jgi:hypothetical protein